MNDKVRIPNPSPEELAALYMIFYKYFEAHPDDLPEEYIGLAAIGYALLTVDTR